MKPKKNVLFYVSITLAVLIICSLVAMAIGLATGMLVFVAQENVHSQPVAKVRLTRIRPPTMPPSTATNTPLPKPTAKVVAVPTDTAPPVPATVEGVATPLPAQAPVPLVANTPMPTQPSQNVPPTFTPLPGVKVAFTSTPAPNTPTSTPNPNATPTSTLNPNATITMTPSSTSTPTPTQTPTKTTTPKPGETRTATAIPSATPIPTETVMVATATPAPTNTPASTVGRITGRVVLNGSAVDGITLQLEDQAYQQIAETKSSGGGGYSFADLPPSNEGYNVLFKQGANSSYEKQSVSWGWIGPVALQAGSVAQLPDFEISIKDFKQTTPKDNASFSALDISANNPLKFEWTSYPNATKYWVDLAFDDAQLVVWQSPLVENTSVNFNGNLSDGKPIAVGNYWWGVGIQQKSGAYSLVVYANLMLPLKIK